MQLDRQATSIARRTKVAQEAVRVLEDGTVFRGRGLGLFGQTLGEVCFNTARTGYQEILTGPSNAGQIITFTLHIGNVGTNVEEEDVESRPPTCRGVVLREDITFSANRRAPAIWVHNSSKADILRPAQPRSAEAAR
jgi:carbamoyl-phosphate synthase small subunit